MSELFRSREQTMYCEKAINHLKMGGAPLLLEAAAGLGKTRAYLYAFASHGGRVVISVPTRALAQQLVQSVDWALTMHGKTHAIYTPRRDFESAAEYRAHRQECLEVEVLVCTHQIVLLDVFSGGVILNIAGRDAILFDEADQLPDAAALRFDCAIDGSLLTKLGINSSGGPQATVKKVLKALDAGALGEEDVAEIRATCNALLKALSEKSSGELKWFKVVGESDGGVMLKHSLPARVLRPLYSHPRLCFTSATLTVGHSFDDFKRALGLVDISPFSCCIEPKHHGELEFTYADWDVDDGDHAQKVAGHIKELEDSMVLVVTTSFDEAAKIHGFLNNSTLRFDGETHAQAAQRMLQDGKKVLITPAAWAGLDTPIRWRHVVLPRVPYSPPTEIDGKQESRYIDSVNSALRKVRQVLARGLRHPDSYCTVHMLDKRFQRAVFKSAVPSRFAQTYEAKYAISEVRTRQSEFRKLMFAQWGGKCAITDCSVAQALEAAHIGAKGGWRKNHTTGVLLRADIHRLFDAGQLSIVNGKVYTRATGYEQYNGVTIERLTTS